MEHIAPWFYQQFRCIAQHCSDTCCAGWDIYIDPETLARYEADQSGFGLYRQSKIVKTQDGALFAMDETRRCPFLTAENLCTMIQEDGEGALCHICTHHPRFYNSYGVYDEAGIGLCCPEGSRLLLSAPLRFRRKHIPCETPPDPMAETVFQLREVLQEVLLDVDLPFANRCAEALAIAQQAQTQLYETPPAHKETTVTKGILWETLLVQMMALLPIDDQWQQYIQGLHQQVPALLAGEESYCQSDCYDPNQYGNIAAYLLYRHFPDALWDGSMVARLTFSILSTLFVHMCYVSAWLEQGSLTQEDKVYHLKNWSKQVEYCEENTQAFLDDCRQNPVFTALMSLQT